MTSHERTPDQVGLKPSWTGDHLRVLDDDDVVHLLRAAVKREGSQAAFAKRYGLDRVSMNSMLNGKRRVSATVLKAFGLRKVYVIDDYEVLSGLGVSNLSHDASGRQAGCEAALASGRRSRAVTRVFPSLAQSGHFETEFRRPFLGKADMKWDGDCYPSCSKRCFSVGDRDDCLFTTVRFAQPNLSSPFARAAAGPTAATVTAVFVKQLRRRFTGRALCANADPAHLF